MHSDRLPECEEIQRQIVEHIKESVIYRDKMTRMELRVDILEKDVMKNAIIGGLIGALIGSGAAPAVSHLVTILIGQ